MFKEYGKVKGVNRVKMFKEYGNIKGVINSVHIVLRGYMYSFELMGIPSGCYMSVSPEHFEPL